MAMIACSSSSSSSSSPTSPPWLPLFLFFLCVFSTSFFSSTAKILYAPHCNTIVPEAKSTNRFTTSHSAFDISHGYFSGGAKIFHLEHLSFYFRPIYLYKTLSPDSLQVDGELVLRGAKILEPSKPSRSYWNYSRGNISTEETRFHFSGFWSKSTGMLCMVGHGTFTQTEGKSLPLSAVFKLFYPQNATIHTSLVKGTLESLSSDDADDFLNFDPIFLLAYAQNNYNFTMKSQANRACSSLPELENSMSFDDDSVCNFLPYLAYQPFKLDYESCSGDSSGCKTLDANLGFSSRFVYFDMVQCRDEGKLQLLMEFSNKSRREYARALVPEKSLIGEGYWDRTKNRLCLVACHIHNQTSLNETSLTAPSVSDCSIALSLIFPSVITLKNRSDIVGQMWSNKNKDDAGYLSNVSFRSWRYQGFTTASYKYTEIDSVRKNCRAILGLNSSEHVFPGANDLNFRADFNDSAGRIGWGRLKTLSVGDKLYEHAATVVMSASSPTQGEESSGTLNKTSLNKDVNVSCSITYRFRTGRILKMQLFSNFSEEFELAAEGIYSSATGMLCMRGCRYPNLDSENHMPMDCDISINIQFPPLNPKSEDQGIINGTITSTREESDSLYFKPITVFFRRYMFMATAAESIWRMEMETVMVLISLTFSCLCILLQIVHANKHRDVVSSISIVMLLILNLGFVIPLVLNFEALFVNQKQNNLSLGNGGWLDVNEVIVRTLSLATLFLTFRLLQLVWSVRSAVDRKDQSAAERKSLKLCLPLYFAGALLTWWANRKTSSANQLRDELILYAGLVLDGFLLPQIVFNLFHKSKERASMTLTPFFYVGITLTRALPHLYDAYRKRRYVNAVDDSSTLYARADGEFYSVAWDVVVPCGGMLLAVIVGLQQRFGGGFLVPRRLMRKNLAGYESVQAVGL
ncbi:uncharacterized protein LOC121986573 [Zingiber officinale]|uniref:RING-type E3 ubiquitin transferase n=1 Tax=Zingiber officinale TaxID=94328 RepID=A0A8J5GEH5_ZINOF|nr:uncharacterized protein LOC121986573 [Zingiber officinale]KAG6503039.1 hypothetical protein ZIOFF_035328 [Zingiber officinale]